ncbi:putative serine/threonine-protein kinase iks1 [Tieghemiomyces parasiticus]|uniref:non-specific serine/threonine protein kinase n=1 Tax=Tieghemiomyces parasiticus TaxID=78921 RepID=A0A9W8ALD9_9FUNG|nr:putative serine/threonine-protein kinase iks1 [Tieghemiomyces parasiticus]
MPEPPPPPPPNLPLASNSLPTHSSTAPSPAVPGPNSPTKRVRKAHSFENADCGRAKQRRIPHKEDGQSPTAKAPRTPGSPRFTPESSSRRRRGDKTGRGKGGYTRWRFGSDPTHQLSAAQVHAFALSSQPGPGYHHPPGPQDSVTVSIDPFHDAISPELDPPLSVAGTNVPTGPPSTVNEHQVVRYSPTWTVILRRPQHNQMVLFHPERNHVVVQPYIPTRRALTASNDVSTSPIPNEELSNDARDLGYSAESSSEEAAAPTFVTASRSRSRSRPRYPPPESGSFVCPLCRRPFDMRSAPNYPPHASEYYSHDPYYTALRRTLGSGQGSRRGLFPPPPSEGMGPWSSFTSSVGGPTGPALPMQPPANFSGESAADYMDRNYFRLLATLPRSPLLAPDTTYPLAPNGRRRRLHSADERLEGSPDHVVATWPVIRPAHPGAQDEEFTAAAAPPRQRPSTTTVTTSTSTAVARVTGPAPPFGHHYGVESPLGLPVPMITYRSEDLRQLDASTAGGDSSPTGEPGSDRGGVEAKGEVRGTPPPVPRVTHLSPGIYNQGYYANFFIEEKKLGKGLRGSVYLCQHVLDNIPLGQYAVKKVAVGDDKAWLKRMLREVKLLETLRHPNIVDYKHSWVELQQLTRFGPKVPCLFILMDCANGGNLEEYVEGDRRHCVSAPRSPTTAASGDQVGGNKCHPRSPTESDPPSDSARSQRDIVEERKRQVRLARLRRRQSRGPESSGPSASSPAPPASDRVSSPPPSLTGMADRRGVAGLAVPPSTTAADAPLLPPTSPSPTGPRLLSLLEICTMFQDICHGLHHLHSLGIIHRDIKPPNLLLHYANPHNRSVIPRVILTDFGECEDTAAHREFGRRTGATGTLEFMAPELIQTDRDGHFLDAYSVKADVWSLGMILHYLCYSRLPYSQVEDVDILRLEILALRNVHVPPPLPGSRQGAGLGASAGRKDKAGSAPTNSRSPAIPEPLNELIRILLNPRPEARPEVSEILRSPQWRSFEATVKATYMPPVESTVIPPNAIYLDENPCGLPEVSFEKPIPSTTATSAGPKVTEGSLSAATGGVNSSGTMQPLGSSPSTTDASRDGGTIITSAPLIAEPVAITDRAHAQEKVRELLVTQSDVASALPEGSDRADTVAYLGRMHSYLEHHVGPVLSPVRSSLSPRRAQYLKTLAFVLKRDDFNS